MVVQHNIPALNSYNRLGANNKAVASNLKKLSSGYKINSAADNAAGLAISEKMRAQITGLEACQQNAKDGISLVQTAEGALTEVHSMLNRMVELSTLASNGTYSDSNREKYQNEIQELKDEIDRIADSTNFNGIDLLNGNLSGGAVKTSSKQVLGANISKFFDPEVTTQTAFASTDLSTDTVAGKESYEIDGQVLEIDWTKGDAKTVYDSLIGKDYSSANLDLAGTENIAKNLQELFEKEMKAQGVTGEIKIEATAAGVLSMKSLNASSTGSIGYLGGDKTDTTNTEKSVGTVLFGNKDGLQSVAKPVKKFENSVLANDTFTMKINDTTVDVKITSALNKTNTLDQVATAVQSAIQTSVGAYNTAMGLTGKKEALTATDFTVTADESGGLKVTYGGKEDITFSFGEKTEDRVEGKTAAMLGLVNKVSSSGIGGSGLSLQIGDTADDYNRVVVSIQDCHASSLGVSGINVTTEDSAAKGISKIRDAIDTVSKVRAKLGATQNRLDHTLNNLETTTENLTESESRIRDTDMAKEMMQYTKNNILVQSSQAMLAQANQLPQGVLQLLQ